MKSIVQQQSFTQKSLRKYIPQVVQFGSITHPCESTLGIDIRGKIEK